ncbi:CAP domain-containing protein [Bizionia sediminis]|uniref:CAP domain-containing protein n=1 Tax=Bizionia sediminis TaxID=1737064 RepID=A0ABW5KXI2_9FLAO
MKQPTLLPVMALLVMFMISCSPDAIDNNPPNMDASNLVVPETKTIEIEIMELINDHRLSNGMNPLSNVDIIKAQAFNHTDYMVTTGNVSHANFVQRKLFLENYLGAQDVSENVAYGFTSAQSVVAAWLRSDKHRENIEGDFTDFDISAEQNENGKWYYTNIFVKK